MPSPELNVLRECQDRILEREGIPMVLALVSEVGPVPAAASAEARADGSRLAARMTHYRDELLPGMREDDNGCLISILQAVSFVEFAGPSQPLPVDVADVAQNKVGE